LYDCCIEGPIARKNNKAFGDKRERQVKELLVFEGWEVRKARMSFGNADLLAFNHYTKERRLIQVKGTKAGPYADFGPASRQALLDDAIIAGASAWLAHWPAHGELKWYESKEWP